MSQFTEAFKRGWDAFINNMINPFTPGTREFEDFREGYTAARDFTYWADTQ